MCVGIPGKVIETKDKQARVKQDNHFHWLDTSLIEDEVKTGDYLISYQTAAINKITAKEAQKILSLIKGAA